MTDVTQEVQDQLSNLFGTYRAEWLRDKLFDLYSEPKYFPELTRNQSCVLVGGRGTGKTTVLRGLSYQGQLSLSKLKGSTTSAHTPYIGIYHRINTSHVTAFQGAELDELQWIRLFSHYLNLLICELIVDFAVWFEVDQGGRLSIDAHSFKMICASLHLPPVNNIEQLRCSILDARIAFEACINNVADSDFTKLSLLQRPIDIVANALLSCEALKGRHFFLILDEYENLCDYQQKVVNTLIKHSTGDYFFKIGVKEMGWTCKATLNPKQQLISPADYSLVDISDKFDSGEFNAFARSVCESRLNRITLNGEKVAIELDYCMPGLTAEEEAKLLGVEEVADRLIADYTKTWKPDAISLLDHFSPFEIFMFDGFVRAQNKIPSVAIYEFTSDLDAWRDKYNNYKYSALFAIRTRKTGIDKYYCGFSTLALIAGGNIRYMLELVDQAFLMHVREGGQYGAPLTQKTQTRAAQAVGQMNLSELSGVSIHGAQLTQLILGLGRIFQNMAASPFGHAAEVNQFTLSDDSAKISDILRVAVMHLALLRHSGTKMGAIGDTIKEDYSVHPIFSALFEFSPRKKRKMAIESADIEGLFVHPKQTIEDVLKRQNRRNDVPLPRQLRLFTEFFEK